MEEAYYQTIANIPVALYRFEISIDGAHLLKYVSNRFFELFEIPLTTALTDVATLFDRILIEDRQGFDRATADDGLLGQPWNWEGRWILPSGKIEWIRAESRQTYLPDGSIVWDGILINITNRKQVEAQLYQTNQSLLEATRHKDEFIANISHEVRTPLSTIFGMSEILKEEILGTLNPQQLESLEMIDRSSEQLLSLMNDILDISNISQGKLALEISSVAVLQLCHSSLAFLQQAALDKQIQLQLEATPAVGNIAVDERRLRQVLLELISNAIKFSPTGSSVVLSVTRADRDDGWIDFTITDTGIGIAPEDLDRLFQPFIQIDCKLNRHYVGAGLGLSLAQQLVGLHGGRIRLSSTLGSGSQFVVRLPHKCLIFDRSFVAFDRSTGDDINDQFLN
jgi:signal transduction histidine kinase